MYLKPFYITRNLGNNAFSFNKRKEKKLYVPNLIKINSFDEIQLGDKTVFEDYDFNGKLQTCFGLKNFYEINLKGFPKIYLFDNHNHAYYFWHKSRLKGIIGDNCNLYHIDEHSDMRDPGIYLEKQDLDDLEKIFEYTNYKINVGNYIIPAIHDGLIKEVIQIRSESELNKVNNLLNTGNDHLTSSSIILNLDLDFFQPCLDYIDYNLKKEVILKLTKKASVITVATSPFFINQDLALKVFRDLFTHF